MAMPTIRQVTDNGDGTLTVLVAVTINAAALKETKAGKTQAKSKADRKAAILTAVSDAVTKAKAAKSNAK